MQSMILAAIVSVALLVAPSDSQAASLVVDAKANIFSAGEAAAFGDGVLPPSFSFVAESGLILTFSSITGTVTCCGGTGGTNIDSASGVSGIIQTGATMFLIGVFTDGTNPTDPAPPPLDFSAGATAFTDLSPLLDQAFFIGDGLTGTGTGTVQQFHVPTNATTLFLGFADGLSFTGTPDFYGDNIGTLAATFAIAALQSVPEPTILALLGGTLLWLAAVGRRPRPE